MGLDGVKLGLSEYLSGNAELGQVIYDVGLPNMHVLFSGKLVPNASALLSAKWLGKSLCMKLEILMIMLFLIHRQIWRSRRCGNCGICSVMEHLLVIENGVTKKKTLCHRSKSEIG